MNETSKRVFTGLGFLRGFVEQARLSWHLFRDPRVPAPIKIIPVAVILYVLSPVDLIADFIPVLGQMDDIAVIGLGLTLFIRVAPPAIVNEYLAELRGETINH